ncbi:pilin [Pseudomonas turukhanskensis]|uniref:Pilin n=1 Tax=Pseudomonas turukhanskensis TaxID=1806536 RepID=A0A9W6NHB1_9PSED|nr:pilin [Pseudomonas turukhanskensis]GLK90700.1 prepilin-type N-terminal cleavage/methylation domain-containing protein [Pseudomonas turukhanskensis]
MKAQMQKGFTLIELMIVVAIIGILAAIAIPQYQTYVAKSQVSRVVAETGAVKTAIETCILDGKTADIGDPATTGNCDPQVTGSSLMADGDAWTATSLPAGTSVPSITLPATADSNTLIVAKFGNSASQAIKDAEITWTRDPSGTWKCTSTAEAKYNAPGCPAGS